jgi:hypothetical protein
VAYPTYCTQLDSTGNGHYRCGGATLASVLLDDGWNSDPWELTVQISDEEGWTDVGCTSDQLIDAAGRRGLDGRKWVYMEELEEALKAGQAVAVLCQNQYLTPRPYPLDYGWEALHWIRALAVADRDDVVYCYDPLCWMVQKDGSAYQGPTVTTQDQLADAIRVNGWPEAGVLLSSRQGRDLNRNPQ